ncbi:MAG: hypothetical protein QME94_10395, partial [Anaerolineae bacterium]|nr:hypothetical protein [Anaerolineae bacterium]
GEVLFWSVPQLEIESLSAQEVPGRGPELRLTLANGGEVGLLPRVLFGLHRAGGAELGTVRAPDPGLLLPAQRAEISAAYPAILEPGDYILAAEVLYGAAEPLYKEVQFRIQAASQARSAARRGPGATPEPTAAPAGRLAPGRNWLCVGALGVLIVLGIGLLLLAILPGLAPYRRRFRRAARALREKD